MNIGDKLRLKNIYGDVVEHEVVYVKPRASPAKGVKWDDGQVTSVYSRHLQKELV